MNQFVNWQKLKSRISKLHQDIDGGIGTKANYPQDCDSDWYWDFEKIKACFQELSEVAGIPVDPILYWLAVEHFAECFYCEASDEENARQQDLIDQVQKWLEAVECTDANQ